MKVRILSSLNLTRIKMFQRNLTLSLDTNFDQKETICVQNKKVKFDQQFYSFQRRNLLQLT